MVIRLHRHNDILNSKEGRVESHPGLPHTSVMNVRTDILSDFTYAFKK